MRAGAGRGPASVTSGAACVSRRRVVKRAGRRTGRGHGHGWGYRGCRGCRGCWKTYLAVGVLRRLRWPAVCERMPHGTRGAGLRAYVGPTTVPEALAEGTTRVACCEGGGRASGRRLKVRWCSLLSEGRTTTIVTVDDTNARHGAPPEPPATAMASQGRVANPQAVCRALLRVHGDGFSKQRHLPGGSRAPNHGASRACMPRPRPRDAALGKRL